MQAGPVNIHRPGLALGELELHSEFRLQVDVDFIFRINPERVDRPQYSWQGRNRGRERIDVNVNFCWEEGGRNDQMYMESEGESLKNYILIEGFLAHLKTSTFAICLYSLAILIFFSGKKSFFYLAGGQPELFASGRCRRCQPRLCWQQYSVCSPSWEKSGFTPGSQRALTFHWGIATWSSTNLYNTAAITEAKTGLRLKILIVNLISSIYKHREEI